MKNKIIYTALFFCLTVLAGFCGDFSIEKLPNGQTLIIKEVKNNPIVTVDTWIKTGSINETDSNTGASHFLEHLFFKGTTEHPTGEFDKILESKGAIVNAATSKDFTHYYITLPTEYFNTAIELQADMLSNPQIPRKEMEKERKVVLEEMARGEDNPNQKIYNSLNSLLYTNHPYKRRVIGTKDVISNISREDILDYFHKYYAPSSMVTVVVGDIDKDKVTEAIKNNFKAEYKKPVNNKFPKEHQLQSQKRNIEYTDVKTGYMLIGFRGVNIQDSDTYALDVLAQILGGGKASRLYRNTKEQKGLAHSISAENASMKDDGIIYISANFTPLNKDKLEQSIFEEIRNIRQYGVTEEELNTAINNIEQDTYYARESTSNIAQEIGYIMALSDSPEIYEDYVENITKVTSKDVQRVAQKYLGKNRSAVAMLLPKNSVEQKTISITKHVAQKVSTNNGITKYMVDNKSTLLINKHNNNDIVAITILAKGGEFLERVKGEGTVMAALMLKGTTKYSSQELAKLMEENGIKISANNLDDYFAINIQTTRSKIDLTMDIVNEIMNNSTFDENELEKVRSEILAKIRQKRDLPMNIALDNYKTLLYEGSVYSNSNQILEKSIPAVTRENVLDFYKRIFDSKNIIISVNGNADEQYLINNFGSFLFDKKQPVVNYSDYKVTKLTSPKKKIVNQKGLQTAWLFYGWQTDSISNKQDFVTLKVINSILGLGMSSRLFQSLREEDGLAYQLGSSYSCKVLGGNFVTYIGTKPATVDYALKKIKTEIENLKMEFVSDSELQDAKDKLKGGFILALEKNSDKADIVAQFEADGLGYDFLDTYIKMIDKVTASDIVRVVNKYFNDVYVESIIK